MSDSEQEMDEEQLSEIIEKAIIGKRVVAVAWTPVPEVDGLFVLDSMTLQGGATLEFWNGSFAWTSSPQSSAATVLMKLTEDDHADSRKQTS